MRIKHKDDYDEQKGYQVYGTRHYMEASDGYYRAEREVTEFLIYRWSYWIWVDAEEYEPVEY